MPITEVTVHPSVPMPKGYGFLPKGIQYKTLHCRKLTREAGKTLYVVVDAKKRRIGIRVPTSILHQVHRKAKDSLSTRRAAVQKRDELFLESVAAELETQFPRMPEKERAHVLNHGFKKHSGRVGRTGTIPLPRKILLAIVAHVRHRHTKYDALLADGVDRTAARNTVNKRIECVMRNWGYTGELAWYFKNDQPTSSGESESELEA